VPLQTSRLSFEYSLKILFNLPAVRFYKFGKMISDPLSRRQFVQTSMTALAGAAAGIQSAIAQPDQTSLTIAQVIDLISKSISLDVSNGTVDTIKSGDPNQKVTGILTTMFATVDVIRAAVSEGVNFIIAHEPTFYNHYDEINWLEGHEVFEKKQALLKKHNMVVWRFHDYWHANRPDGILMGVVTKLGWSNNQDRNNPETINLPGSTLSGIIEHSKKSLGIEQVRYIGELSAVCQKVVILPGAWGGRRHIEILNRQKPDLLICGELQEWETSEYVRDARALGLKTSLIVLGHAVSEEPGMEWLVGWIKTRIPGINVRHVPSGNPFRFA